LIAEEKREFIGDIDEIRQHAGLLVGLHGQEAQNLYERGEL
jgi:hypothetical protein